MDDYELLNLFIAAVSDDLALFVFADALEEAGHPLAVMARETRDAVPEIPEHPERKRKLRSLAAGTGWRIEYHPFQRPLGQHRRISRFRRTARVLAAYAEAGSWREVENVATRLAPLGVRRNEAAVRAMQSLVSPRWLMDAFVCVRLNILSFLIVGSGVATTSGLNCTVRRDTRYLESCRQRLKLVA